MGTRVKTDDAKMEKAFALADYIQAAREGTHEGMKLGELIDALKGIGADTRIEFDFGGFEPTELGSYRGYYSDLAIGFGETGSAVGELREALEGAVGQVFEGYKGGEYRMDRSTPVWVANYGRSNGVAVVAVEVQVYRVVLRTALID